MSEKSNYSLNSKVPISCVVPNSKMAEDVKSEAKNIGIDVLVYEGLISKALEIAKHEGVEVLVARGGTAEMIKNAEIDVYVVEIPITGFDIMQALFKAQENAEYICIVGYSNMLTQLRQINSMLHLFKSTVETHVLNRREDIENTIIDAKRRGFNCILGGLGSCQIANKYGLVGILIESSIESINEALRQAKNVIEIKHREQENNSLFKAIMNYTFEGIISIDMDNNVTACNAIAKEYLELGSNEVIGCSIHQIGFPTIIKKFILDKKEHLNEVVTFGDKILIMNRVTMIYNGQEFGKVLTLKDVTKVTNLEQASRRKLSKKGLKAKITFENIVYRSPEIANLIKRAKTMSSVDSFILIEGNTGTGKEMFAQSIHNESKRKDGPFVAVNCSALTENLLESELFGYSEGAFTGARKEGKPGLFEIAHGGTIFLDEIGTIAIKVQLGLLRVIEEKEVMRIGDDKIIPIDVRVIAATNDALDKLVANGTFREDLYYRLNVLNITIPPLQERKSDIEPLLEYFLKSISKNYGIKKPFIEKNVVDKFLAYSWPGNVRELRNIAENLIIMKKNIIKLDDVNYLLSFANKCTHTKKSGLENIDLKDLQKTIEKNLIDVLIESGIGKNEIARLLDIDRTTLWRKMRT